MVWSSTEAPDRPPRRSQARQYCEATCAIAALTGIASIAPVGYRAFSLVYLLGLVAMSLRLDRGPVLVATILSALGWDFFVIPPKYSFRILDINDTAMFGTYVIVALISSQLTARIRSQGEHLGAVRERANLLAESDRLHRALFDSLSHEFKTPITVLRSASLALGQRTTGVPADLADEIFQATDRLERLVGNLLDQARLESGMLVPLLDWCDPGELIQAACLSLQKVLVGREPVPDD
jgi:two-component system sensor histidine kinase KdpD